MPLRIAIIGGVAGGAGAAAAARRAAESAKIDVFEAGPYISFANCGLPYHVSGEIADSAKLLVTTPAQMKRRFDVDVHVRTEVVAIDRAEKALRVRALEGGAVSVHPYDRLVIATGARAFRPPLPGIEHPRIVECRTVDDAFKLNGFAAALPNGRALVVGGGFIGVEVAEALVMRGLETTVVDLAPQVLPPLDPEIAGAARAELERRGVRLVLGAKLLGFEHGPAESVARLDGDRSLAFDFAVMSIGVLPEVALARAAGLDIGPSGGLVVDEFQRTSDPDIFAAGDVTDLVFWPTGERLKLALAGPANKQARAAGANAAQAEPTLSTSGAAGSSIVRVFDLAFGMTGLSEKAAVARKIPYEVVYTQNGHHAGYFPGAEPLFIKLVFGSVDGRLLGAQVFGREGVDKRVDVFATAIRARFTVHDLADLDLAYAPPFGAAKDPVIVAGMVASNVLRGRTRIVTPKALAAELSGPAAPFVLDVRTAVEHAAGRIEGALNVSVDDLRGALDRLPRDRPIVVHCAVGYRGYVAERILAQRGFRDVRNLTGGFRAWTLWQGAAPPIRT